MENNLEQDFIIIGAKKVPIQNVELLVADLSFYPENPRVYSALNSDGSVPSQEDIYEHMSRLDHVRELRDDIERNGGLMEAIIVRDGDLVVLEGNSRLAAYKMLLEKDPLKWGKIKCKLIPSEIDDASIFKLIGQYHIKGKKPWEPYEQANYLYRRCQETKTPIEYIAEELNIKKNDAKKMVDAVAIMKENNESDTKKFSYYYEYIKDSNIKKFRDTNPDLDTSVIKSIKNGDIKRAEDIRLIGKVAGVNDKQSKKLMRQIADGDVSIYDAYEAINDTGKLKSSLSKLREFRKTIAEDKFRKGFGTNPNVAEIKFEIKQIRKRLDDLMEVIDDGK